MDEGTLGVCEDGIGDNDAPPVPNGGSLIELTDEADVFEGGADDDTIFADDDGDDVSGGAGDDRIFLNEGDDVSDAGSGDMAGDDLIRGGDDVFNLGIPADSENPVIITDFEPSERLIVEVDESGANAEASIVLSEDGADTELQIGDQTIAILQGYTNLDTLNIEFVAKPAGEADGPEVAANDAAQTYAGTQDTDVIVTGAGNDVVNAGASDDVVDATGGGDNVINAGLGDDTVIAGNGDDLINGSLGADVLDGGAGSDMINGGFAADTLSANDAAGTAAADTLKGEAGADTLIGDDGDVMTGGEWRDTFVVETIEAGDDVVTVTDFNVTDDALEIGASGDVTFVSPNAGADTTVLVDGIAVFLLEGVTPADMANAHVTTAA